MKLIAFLFASLLISCPLYGQVEEVKKADDKAQDIFNTRSRNDNYFSKTIYVNPFIGTGGHGHTYPGATAPFGMIQLSPDTRHDGWDGCSGYHYSDDVIYGFSHTHLSGTGVSDYGDLLIVPQVGKPHYEPGYSSKNGYGATFSHSNETAMPGYYQVHLEEPDIDVRLTVSERAGYHEYTFNNPRGKKFILIDLDHRDKLLSHTINVLDNNSISGSRTSEAWASRQHFFFHMETSVPFEKSRLYTKNGSHKLLLTFDKSTKQVSIRVGISAVSAKGAQLNLEKEIPAWNFNTTHANVARKWNKELDKIHFVTEDKEVMTNFYTALYHSFIAPNIFCDVDGQYRGRDHEVHQLPEGETQYTVFSLWDTYRATHPLFTLVQQARTNDFIKTFLRQYKEGGDLPVWELAGNETECMIGFHSVSVIADAYVKGIRGYNAYEALEAMIYTSELDEYAKVEFNENGFIGTSKEPESVSKTLEYAYDNFCIAQMVDAHKQKTKSEKFVEAGINARNRSFNFVNLYDPQTKFMRARRSGQWFSPFDPAEVNFNYTEANSWQYSLYAPHAAGLLRELIGGKDSLETWLDRLFTTEMALSGRHQADITGLIGQYAHGNEPSHHMAYLYNYTNNANKTQFYVDSILYNMYHNAPDGLSGNEDCGQMSSWYVMSALGLYQIAPGRPVYEIGRPLLDEALIQLENGKQLIIKTKNNSNENKYVQQIIVNGLELKQSFILHEYIADGGTIIFVMGPTPPAREGYRHGETISELPAKFVPAPYFEQENRIFETSTTVPINVLNAEDYDIYYSLDGSDPSGPAGKKYEAPINLSASTTIKAVAKSKNGAMSTVISNEFVQKNTNVSIELLSTYANQYSANGEFTLIDGIRGADEFRTGDWQGYWDQDFDAVVHFKEPVVLSEVGLGYLSDMKSWIFEPFIIQISVSFDGNKYVEIAKTQLTPERKEDMYPHHTSVGYAVNDQRPIHSIKVHVEGVKECPDWHLGAGNSTWLFLDEIFFK